MKKRINMLREFSVPLLAGVVTALVWANVAPASYAHFNESALLGDVSFHFLANDIFMVLFFGVAAAEITQSCLPGGDLYPPRTAISPLFATLGGVIGPVALYFILNAIWGTSHFHRGWGISAATDIALAWVAARLIFGDNHPVIAFLLLLAIADDAIGLAIIAIFYPDPANAVAPLYFLLAGAGMCVAWLLRRRRVDSYWSYLVFGGVPCWFGLYRAHLHPALALVFVVPFLPHPHRESKHLFEEDRLDRSPLARFEYDWKVVVDFGLFLFGLANAGTPLTDIDTVTWLVFASLVAGKTFGITLFALMGIRLGFPLPSGMGVRELVVAAMVAGIGFTVAIFVAGEAFSVPAIQGAAKMGAMLSIAAGPLAFVSARALGIRRTVPYRHR